MPAKTCSEDHPCINTTCDYATCWFKQYLLSYPYTCTIQVQYYQRFLTTCWFKHVLFMMKRIGRGLKRNKSPFLEGLFTRELTLTHTQSYSHYMFRLTCHRHCPSHTTLPHPALLVTQCTSSRCSQCSRTSWQQIL